MRHQIAFWGSLACMNVWVAASIQVHDSKMDFGGCWVMAIGWLALALWNILSEKKSIDR